MALKLPLTIYYCDDDKDDLELFEDIIQTLGHQVRVLHLALPLLPAIHNPPPQASIFSLT